jgi:hypothetical protein
MLFLSIAIEPYSYAQHKLVKLMSSSRANVVKYYSMTQVVLQQKALREISWLSTFKAQNTLLLR